MKGLTIDQLREQLDTEAQRRCKAQEATIKKLHEEVAGLKDLNARLKDRILELKQELGYE